MDGWVKVRDAARYCGVNIKTFRQWLKDGLPHSRLKTGHILVKISNIDEWLRRFEVTESELNKQVNELLKNF